MPELTIVSLKSNVLYNKHNLPEHFFPKGNNSMKSKTYYLIYKEIILIKMWRADVIFRMDNLCLKA